MLAGLWPVGDELKISRYPQVNLELFRDFLERANVVS